MNTKLHRLTRRFFYTRKEDKMVKHCNKCRRRWIVSILDKQEYYICPECEGDYVLNKLVDGVAVTLLV